MVDKLEIDDCIKKPIIEDMIELSALLNSDTDIRKLIGKCRELQRKVRSAPDYKDSPENRFGTFTIWLMISEIFTQFEKRSDKWFEINEETTSQIRKIAAKYFEGIKVALEKDSFDMIIDVSSKVLYETNKLLPNLTQDTK